MSATSPAGEARTVSPAWLRDLIGQAGWAYGALAEHLTARGVPTSKATIGHLCTGHTKSTSIQRATLLAEAVGRTVDTVFVLDVSNVQNDTSPRGAA